MNPIRRLITDSRFHTFIAVVMLGYLVWNYGPLLQIGQNRPFYAISNRLISLVALAFLWGLTNIRTELNPFRSPIHFDIQQQINIISRKLKDIQQQLKKAQNKKFYQSPNIQWHLVIGPCHSGKTSLLNCAFNSDQDYRLTTATQDCAIWNTDDNVFIELGEGFLPSHDAPETCRLLFQEFLKLCDNLGIQFHNIITAIAINQVMTNTVDLDLTRTHQMLTTLIAQNPGLPVSVVFTKCDQMAGFTAFFCDLSMDERQQYCGIRLPFGLTISSLKNTINTHLQQLNRRFHDRLLTRLQQEIHPTQRNAMHDFPYQFEIFCAKSIHFLNELLPDCDINLTGLFFTSSQQTGSSINHLTSQLAEVFSLQKQSQADLYTQQTPYFIAELCQFLLPSFAETAVQLLRPRHKINPLIIPIIITSLMGVGIYQLYHFDINRLELANTTMMNAKAINTQSTIALAQKLDAIQYSIHLLDEKPNIIAKIVRPGHPHKLIEQAQEQYNQLVKTDFAQALDNTLQLKLQELTQESKQENLSELYDTLKIALLLQDPSHRHLSQQSLNLADESKSGNVDQNTSHDLVKQQIYSWYATEWQRSITDNTIRQALLTALSTALKNPQITLPGNPDLIDKARLLLTRSSSDSIIFTILESGHRHKPVILSENPLTKTPITISALYTRKAYKDIIEEEIPSLCEKFAEGDWILGYENGHHNNDDSSIQLTQAVKTRYLNNYLTAWQNILSQFEYAPLSKYSHLISAINNSLSMEAPAIQFLQAIQMNTAEMEGEDSFNEIVGAHFVDLNNVSLDDPSDSLHIALENLAKFLSPLAQSDDALQLAFKATKARLSNPTSNDALNQLYALAKNSPEPVKSYLTSLADNSWNLLIADSRMYISSIWTNIVVPEYQQHCHNRYPLFTGANSEMSLDEFAHFFAPNGTIDTFFKNYVEAFINNTHNGWEWKTMNGQQLALSDDALAAFIRAKLIQKMFFADGQHHPNANFTLTPIALNPDLKNFSIVLNGQRIDYHGPHQPPEPISWPGPHQSGVFIEVADNTDKKNQLGYPGTWGIFRLLDKAQPGKSPSNETLQLSWTIDEKRVDCEITSDNPINPFTPGIINQFRCPQSLI